MGIDAEAKNAASSNLVADDPLIAPRKPRRPQTRWRRRRAVSLKYVVDGKEVGSSSDVCPLAKMAGKVQYMVNGEKTPCETTARISLAKAQYEAATKKTEKKVAAM
jgi:hypothetical protein